MLSLRLPLPHPFTASPAPRMPASVQHEHWQILLPADTGAAATRLLLPLVLPQVLLQVFPRAHATSLML